MKKLRLFSVLLTLVFLVSAISVSSVSAATPAPSSGNTKTVTISGKKIEVNSTVSAKELALLTPDFMETFEPEGVIVSVSSITTDMEAALSTSQRLGNISPNSVISSTKMSVTMVVERLYVTTNYDDFRFTAIATWLSSPLMMQDDTFGIAWSDAFTLLNEHCTLYAADNSEINSGTLATMDPEVGIGYTFSMMVGYNGSGTSRSYNKKAKIEASVFCLDASGTANVVARYAHKYLGVTAVNCSISSTPSVSFGASIGTAWDSTSPAYASFTY
jgi:hypothetical protein